MKNFLYSLFIGLFGIAGLTSIAFLLMYAVQSKQQAHLYSNLAAVREQDTQQEILSQSSVQPTSRNLYLENADMVGWIQIEGTNIDYPVMQTPADPTYYLKHDFEKNYTDYGCPFMQADCDALAPSDNLIIYGHNMKDGCNNPKESSEMQTRNKSFLLRLTEQEYATLKRKSELAGLKMNPFVVSLINGCEIHPRAPDSCKALARQVAAVGNNLNQLARIANFNGKAEDAYLQEAQQIMTRIWLLMKEQL